MNRDVATAEGMLQSLAAFSITTSTFFSMGLKLVDISMLHRPSKNPGPALHH
jgi:hypothetical protein